MSASVRQYLSQLVLALPIEKFESPNDAFYNSLEEPVKLLLRGNASELVSNSFSLILTQNAKSVLSKYPQQDLITTLDLLCDEIIVSYQNKFPDYEIWALQVQLLAVALLQTFIQVNYTGPGIKFSTNELFFSHVDPQTLQADATKLFNLEGQQTYSLTNEPVLLAIAALLFEKLMGITRESSLVGNAVPASIEDLVQTTTEKSEQDTSPAMASLRWWRSRLLQVHMSILSEMPSVLPTISSILLNPSVPNTLSPASDSSPEIQKNIQLIYFLECARAGIHSHTEHLSIPLLNSAQGLSNLDFVLSGAKAKRTKFQKFYTSSLIVLAKSNETSIFDQINNETSDDFQLDSDLLLEKPQFESLDDVQLPDEPSSKKLKLEGFEGQTNDNQTILPIALRQEDIPVQLKELDPNNQPPLNDIDNLQLLLRLTTLKQTSPSGNALVEEELFALVSRVLYTGDNKKINWTIFSRALWERSILETNKSRTIERGILQMTSLIEEIGIKVKNRIIPQATEDTTGGVIASRLRFIHQLPLMTQWSMDVKLAEKYMSLGVIRSAIQIYERLGLACEAALCYAATEDEKQAIKILKERIDEHPDDARAISILGDITEDPSLWERAWEIGKYAKSRYSMARYHYSPPASSGLTKDLSQAIHYMNQCLTISPLNYEYWFFYGCCGLEAGQFDLASEAFTRCVSLDDTNSHAWSNLASALLKQDKDRPAFNALKKAISNSGDDRRSWRIYENYLIVAAKLNEWNDVAIAVRELIDIKKGSDGEASIDLPIIEKLVEILLSSEYPPDESVRLTYFQKSCIDLICNVLPTVITTSSRGWRIVARVELWRKRPWAALECHEKAYRALVHRPELEFQESAWNEAVDACNDLVGAYESLGERPGKHGAGDVVCADWKYKSRTSIRSLMSKGKDMWEDSEGWNRLVELKEEVANQ